VYVLPFAILVYLENSRLGRKAYVHQIFFSKLEKKYHGAIEMLYVHFREQTVGEKTQLLIGLPNPKAV